MASSNTGVTLPIHVEPDMDSQEKEEELFVQVDASEW